jgi:uncharacterized protein YbbK (DUF523 family)
VNILVSACLLGVDCKYSGTNNLNKKVLETFKNDTLIPICPEQLGGLTTPRTPAEIIAGDGADVISGIAKVMDKDGQNVTGNFIRGAEETLKVAQLLNCKKAVLKAKSPSCGCGHIYDGSFSHTIRSGNGVSTQLLIDNGIEVITDEQF